MSRPATVFPTRACSVVALIDELVLLHRRVGGPHVLIRQLEQLVHWSTREGVTMEAGRDHIF